MCRMGKRWQCDKPAEYGTKGCANCLERTSQELDSLYGDMDRERERNNRGATPEELASIRESGIEYFDLYIAGDR